MGFAKDKLSESERIAIAGTLFVVRQEIKKGENGGVELHGLCPIHGEDNPSFSYNASKDTFHCLSCGAGGDLVDLWISVRGFTDQGEGFKKFCAEHNITRDNTARKPPKTRKNSPKNEKKKASPVIDWSVWGKMAPLPDAYVKKLTKERGWSIEIINQLDLRLQTAYLDKKGQVQKVPRAERVAMPIPENGTLYNIRNYKPGASQAKIMSWGKGFGAARLFPDPGTIKKDGPVFICEGEPDTICALSRGLNAITQTSKLTNWPQDHTKHFKNRDVIIVYDADQAGEKYATKAAASLHSVAKQIRLLTWPDYMGKNPDGSWPEKHGEDLTDFFIKHGRSITEFQELVAKAKVYEPPKKEKDDSHPDGVQFFKLSSTGRWTFVPRRLADQILEDVPLMYYPATGLLYKWNQVHWEEYHEDNLKKIAINYLGEESKMQRVSDATSQSRLLATLPHGREPNDQHNWLCLKNTMLDIDQLGGQEFVTAPHKKSYYATYALNVSFNRKLKKCDRWLQYLDAAVKTPAVICQLQEFAGYCLTRDTRFGKALFLIGPGSDGKSTFLKVLRKLVGEQNCSAVAFQDIEDQFYRAALYNKLLNTSTEIGSKALESPMFKAIVTGDEISAAFKNKTPFDFNPFCKLAFATNRLPRILDNSDGLFRRLLPIQFKQQFFGKSDDKGLLEKLEQELDGIFQWALVGLIRLREQQQFTECQETEDLLMSYKRLNNPVLCFVEECCEIDQAGDGCLKDGLYSAYKSYVDRNGYTRMHQQNFFRELNSVQAGLKSYRPRIDGKRPRYIKGIYLKVDIEG